MKTGLRSFHSLNFLRGDRLLGLLGVIVPKVYKGRALSQHGGRVRIKKEIERRREAIAKYVEEGYCKRELLPYLLPKRLWRNVPLEVCEFGGVEVVFHGDDYLDEGEVKKVELRLKEPVALSSIKKWIEEGGLLRALHWILALNRATEPPKVKDELSKRISEKLAELKAALNYIEDVKKKYLG
jgi:hypothetical protein